MKKVIISMVLVLAVALVTAACESAPTKNDGTTRKNEVDAPDWVIHQGLEGRICGIGITPDNDPKLAEDMGRLELARKVVSLGMSLGTIFAELENGEEQKTKSEQEQNAPISEDEQTAIKERFITKSFNKIDMFGEWKSAGKIYKLMCLLTEEEIKTRIDKLFEEEPKKAWERYEMEKEKELFRFYEKRKN